MGLIRGTIRAIIFVVVMLIGTPLVLITALVPWRIRGIRLATWIPHFMARIALAVFNIKLSCNDKKRLLKHHGFVFPNHRSMIDIIALYAVMPMRFLAKAEIRQWPLIGWMGIAVGAVFVKREKKASRSAARESLAAVRRYPPIVLFPEGATNPAPPLLPFRYGAFEIAQQEQIPYIPCALYYDRLDLVGWGSEGLLEVFWRVATFKGPMEVRVILSRTVLPGPDDDAAQLALDAHGAITTTLEHQRNQEMVTAGI